MKYKIEILDFYILDRRKQVSAQANFQPFCKFAVLIMDFSKEIKF